MGLRFRRSVGFGPFRLTATKRGVSGSVGVRGARVGINSKGQVRRTVGIPGSGLYDTEVIGHVGGKASGSAHSSVPAAEGDRSGLVIEPGARNVTQASRKSSGKTVAIVVMAIVIVVLLIALGSK
jgi:hypothetical protein